MLHSSRVCTSSTYRETRDGVREMRFIFEIRSKERKARSTKHELTTDEASSNGLSPLTTSSITSPADQTSLDLEYVMPLSRSGDMYLVVPTTVRFIIVPSLASSAPSSSSRRRETIPKSASLTRPSDETRTFAGWRAQRRWH